MCCVAIGRACAFPLLQTGQAIFTASGFPYSRLLVYFRPRSDLAHEHGTTRCVRSPAVPENKAVLLAALSDVGGLLPWGQYSRTVRDDRMEGTVRTSGKSRESQCEKERRMHRQSNASCVQR